MSKTNYHFPIRIRGIESVQAPDFVIEQEAKWQRGAIGGQVAGSFAEWVVALALWYLKRKFVYKYNIRGTRFVIDFYIDAGPDWIPVDVRHFWGYELDARQRFRKEMVERILLRTLQIVWDFEVSTFEEAVTTLRRVLRDI